MRRLFLFAIILTLAGVGATLRAQNESANGGGGDTLQPGALGSTVAEFELKDSDGKSRSLSALKGAKGTVIVFVSARCPMVRAYNDRIIKLAADFQSQGVNVIGLNANAGETQEEIKAHAASVNYNFPVLIDKGNKIADRLGAERTPETILLNAQNQIVYRGRIDNSASPATVKTSELREAIEDVIAGRAVAKPETTAVGCTIKKAV